MENLLKQDYRNLTLKKIKLLKYGAFGSTVIQCSYVNKGFELILLTAECAKDTGLMELLGKWRKENEHWYLSQFPVSTERTTKWFVEKLTQVPDRILFIIRIEGKYIGHVGLFRFDFADQDCEIDNILRGEKEYPGIMRCAVKGLMGWAISNLGLKGFSLKVLSDNPKAVKLYINLGYREISRIPLIQVSGKDGLEWTEAPQDYKGEAARYYVIMSSI